MTSLLDQVMKNTESQILKTKVTIKKTTDKHLLGPLEQKLFNLQQIKSVTNTQLEKFSKISDL